MRTTTVFSWAGWRVACVVLFGAVATASGAEVLFPEPLHLTRRVSDPISQKTSVVEEYCSGNRIVTVDGRRVAIADYESQQLTEIDRASLTFSIVRFDELAHARDAGPRAASEDGSRSVRALGPRASEAGRTLDAFEVRAKDGLTLNIGIDRTVTLSREALDVLVGAAYPNTRNWQHDAIAETSMRPRPRMQGASNSTAAVAEHGLPADQTLTWDAGGSTLAFRNEVIAVDNRPPPPELLVIPRGARQVEHASLTTKRLLEDLEGGKAKH